MAADHNIWQQLCPAVTSNGGAGETHVQMASEPVGSGLFWHHRTHQRRTEGLIRHDVCVLYGGDAYLMHPGQDSL